MLTVEYDFYRDSYRGKLSQEEFERLTPFAAAALDELCLGRTGGELSEEQRERAGLAFCALLELRGREERREGISAEANDGLRVSYAAGQKNGALYRRTAAAYLGGTGLLYRGVG